MPFRIPSPIHCTFGIALVTSGLLCGGQATASPESPEPIGAKEPLPAAARAHRPTSLEPDLLPSADVPVAPRSEVETTTDPSLLRQARERAAGMVMTALNFVGVRYRRGGDSEASGFDCSGFTRHVFGRLGIVLPRRVDEQASAPSLAAVAREDLQPGDLVFFNTLRRTFSHVGIYIGDNRFVHAPRPGGEVRTENLSFAYWAKRYTGARRAEQNATAGGTASMAGAGPAAVGE